MKKIILVLFLVMSFSFMAKVNAGGVFVGIGRVTLHHEFVITASAQNKLAKASASSYSSTTDSVALVGVNFGYKAPNFAASIFSGSGSLDNGSYSMTSISGRGSFGPKKTGEKFQFFAGASMSTVKTEFSGLKTISRAYQSDSVDMSSSVTSLDLGISSLDSKMYAEVGIKIPLSVSSGTGDVALDNGAGITGTDSFEYTPKTQVYISLNYVF